MAEGMAESDVEFEFARLRLRDLAERGKQGPKSVDGVVREILTMPEPEVRALAVVALSVLSARPDYPTPAPSREETNE